jgi:cytidylate kinase
LPDARKRRIAIAIDGPVGAGKSTAGRVLAARLGYRFLDTGLMYRAVTVAALDRRIQMNDTEALTALASRCDVQVTGSASGAVQVTVDGSDISSRLRDPEVDLNVSAVSAIAGVRKALVEKQRNIALPGGIVMAGRDIGTVVLKDAEVKVFLNASPETRAHRRHEEQQAQGGRASYEEVLHNLRRRDVMDSSRAASPLLPAADAVVLETDGLTLEEVVDRMEQLVAAKV